MANTLSKLERLKQRLAGGVSNPRPGEAVPREEVRAAGSNVEGEFIPNALNVDPTAVVPQGEFQDISTVSEESKAPLREAVSQEASLRTADILDEEAPMDDISPPPTTTLSDGGDSGVDKQESIETVVKSGGELSEITANPAEKGELADALKEYHKTMNAAMSAYRKEKKSLKQRELWDGIIKGVGLMLAGLYGMKTGTDMGGVKVNQTDWASNLTNAREEMNTAMGAAGRSFNIKKEIGAEQNRRNQQIWNRSFQVAREKRLAEDGIRTLTTKSEKATSKRAKDDNKEAAKLEAADKKEVARLKKEIRKEVALLATDKTNDRSKAVSKKNIEMYNEKYRNLTGSNFADTSDVPGKLWGFNPREPDEMLLGGGGGDGEGMPEYVIMIDPADGKQHKIPAASVEKATAGGWTRT